MDYAFSDMGEVSRALASGATTVSSYVSALIAQKHRWDYLNTIVGFDEERVLEAARRLDEQAKREPHRKALHGIPFIAKDNIDTAGMPTTGCTPSLRGHRPARDAPVISRLQEAGAILFGKANMHELAFGITNNAGAFGAARNPYDPRLIPGGSSGGTAAAIAAGIVPFGLGSDTGGSVRVPAALCGIVGLRPTLGRYPSEGVIPISATRDTVGPMARTVKDVARVDSILARDASDLERVNVRSLRLGIPRSYFYADLESSISSAMHTFIERIEKQGATLVEEDIPDVSHLDQAVSFVVVNYEARRELERYLAQTQSNISFDALVEQIATPEVKALYLAIGSGTLVSEEAYQKARYVHRPALQAAISGYLQTHRLDAYLIPSTCMTARPIGEDDTVELNGKRVSTFVTFIRNADPSSNAGTPSITIPIGMSDTGMPIGAMIEGAAGTDRRLLAVALSLEDLCDRLPHPSLRQI
jgi:indoleacetamide hydrolase